MANLPAPHHEQLLGGWNFLLKPGKRRITKNRVVEQIEVNHSPRTIEIFEWERHSLGVFFILCIMSRCALKYFVAEMH